MAIALSADVSPGLPSLRLRVENAAAAVRQAQEHANAALTRSREALAWLDGIARARLEMFPRSPASRKRYRRSPHEVAGGRTSPVLTAPTPELRSGRLLLCDLTARMIQTTLGLLGIRTVERM